MPTISPKKDLTMINFFGPPGIGKTKLSSDVFSAMKLRHESVGLVQEYAKDLLLRLPRTVSNEDIAEVLATRQLHLFAEQHLRQQVIEGVYAFGVTDSPLLMSVFYAPKPYYPSFETLVMEVFNTYKNLNFYLYRDLEAAPFEAEGRVHNMEQSRAKDLEMRADLARLGVPCTPIDLDDPHALKRVLEVVYSAP